jgi:enoyl-CoA hydratase
MFEIAMAGPGKNALGAEMMQFLIDRLDEAAGRPVLLTGSGDSFSAGLNLKQVAALDASGMESFLQLLERMVTALFGYPGPLVGLINGHAIAGGCIVALCCDHRVALRAPTCKIGLNELALGLRYPPRVMAVVRHRVPREHVERVVLGAELFDPHAALALGLIDEIAEDGRAAAERELRLRASYDAAAYAAAKAQLRGDGLRGAGDDGSFFTREVLPAWTAPSLRERIAALLSR